MSLLIPILLTFSAPVLADSAEGSSLECGSGDTVSVESLGRELQGRLSSARPLGATVRLNVGDDYLFVDGNGSTNTVTVNRGGKADASINLGAKHFQRWLSGALDLSSALRSGQFAVEGDMGVAYRLAELAQGTQPQPSDTRRGKQR